MAAGFALGVIGVGSMGGALVRGVVGAGALDGAQVVVSDASPGRASALAEELGVERAETNVDAARDADCVVVAVKPGTLPHVIEEIAPVVGPEQTLVSVAAGVPLDRIREALGQARPALVRVMPNTPALVGAGMFAVAAPDVAAEALAGVERLLAAVGDVVRVDEGMMDAVTGLSGSGPAFVFVMIEALADGGVAAGLPRSVAQRLAVQTVAGAAKLVRETGQHPGALKDGVASPGGTTIVGLAELERSGFRSAVSSAVLAAANRAREMSGGR
jgi:pyrroline-5-carboxylate reductase